VDYLNVGMPWSYILGLNYYLEDSFLLDRISFLNDSRFLPVSGPLIAAGGPGLGTAQNDFWSQHARSYAMFGEVTLHAIPDVWSFTGGFRYSHDQKHAIKSANCVSVSGFLCNPSTNPAFGG